MVSKRLYECDGCKDAKREAPGSYIDSNIPLIPSSVDRPRCPHSVTLCEDCTQNLKLFLMAPHRIKELLKELGE